MSKVLTAKKDKAVGVVSLTEQLLTLKATLNGLVVDVGVTVDTANGDRDICSDVLTAVSMLCGAIDTADVKRNMKKLEDLRIPDWKFPVTDWLNTDNIPSAILEEMNKSRNHAQQRWMRDKCFPSTNPKYILLTKEGNGFLSPEGVFYSNDHDGHASTARDICSALGIPVTSNRNGEAMLVDTCGWVKFALYTTSEGNYKTNPMQSILWQKKMTRKQEDFILGLDKEAKALGWVGIGDKTMKCLLEKQPNNNW